MSYRALRGVHASRSQFALARSFADIAEAVRVMGEGIVVNGAGRIVAFHERQLPWVSRGLGDWKA